MAACEQLYAKHFIPLESNPDVFNILLRALGVPASFHFQDVVALDEPTLLPHPALALILIFPTSASYERQKAEEEATYDEASLDDVHKRVTWFKQTINNACGLYAILHAVCNSSAKDNLVAGSPLKEMLETCLPLQILSRAAVLENSIELEQIYRLAALQGDSEPPTNPEEEVDFHYICFVRSASDGHLYELDGDRKGPVDKGTLESADADLLSPGPLQVISSFVDRESGTHGFSLMALVHSDSQDPSS